MSTMISGVSNALRPYADYSSAKKTDTSASAEKATAEAASGGKTASSVGKMSESDRAALVSQLKADLANQEQQFTSYVSKMLGGQAAISMQASDLWKFLASGNYTVDAAISEQAQKDISEDGYWGVSQTSQRLFDFACALAGDDTEKMKEMQAAVEKGYRQATGAWGKELPGICKDTYDATNKLFEDYYASKEA